MRLVAARARGSHTADTVTDPITLHMVINIYYWIFRRPE
jgi:hypothetical protein